jgi:hypothetical protein
MEEGRLQLSENRFLRNNFRIQEIREAEGGHNLSEDTAQTVSCR